MGMRTILLVGLVALTAGCAGPSVKEYAAPDGTTVKAVKCPSDPQKCYQAASDSCPERTYQIISSESHAGGLAADVLPGPVTWYGFTYACGPSDGKLASVPFQGQQFTPPPRR
jgi:hypothetical protein